MSNHQPTSSERTGVIGVIFLPGPLGGGADCFSDTIFTVFVGLDDCNQNMILVGSLHVFGVSDPVRLKPVCTATEDG